MGEIIQFNRKEAKLGEQDKTVLIQRRKAAIQKLPQFRGSVPSKTNLRGLRDVKRGEIFWIELDNQAVVVTGSGAHGPEIQPLDETASISTGMTVYELNKQIQSAQPPLEPTDENIDRLYEGLSDILASGDTHYCLYSRELHSITLFKRVRGEANLSNFLSMFNALGQIVSFDTAKQGALTIGELWVRTHDNPAALFYLFPYDTGIITF